MSIASAPLTRLVHSLVCGLACSLSAAACGGEILPPSAAGQISLLPGQVTDGFTTVEIRLQEDDDGGQLNLADIIKDGDDAEARLPLAALPMDYEIEHDAAGSAVQQWRVIVWLSKTEESQSPVGGDFVGSELIELEDCTPLGGDPTFCGPKDGVDVLIDAIVQ